MLQGAALVASTLETDVLAARGRAPIGRRSRRAVHVGRRGVGRRRCARPSDGRIRLCFADQLALLAPSWEQRDPPDGPLHDAIRANARRRTGASFWSQLRAAARGLDRRRAARRAVGSGVGRRGHQRLARAAAGGARRGVAEGRRGTRCGPAPRPAATGPARTASARRPAPGRWSLVAPLLLPAPTPTEAAHAQALQLVERHGVVTREAVLAEGVVGGFAAVYGVLKVLEERGQVRRGYFVAGLGAAQFAVPGAVDRLRSVRETPDPADPSRRRPGAVVLAATDPAQPYGAALAWPDSPGRPARSARARGAPGRRAAGVVRPQARHLVTFPAADVRRSGPRRWRRW